MGTQAGGKGPHQRHTETTCSKPESRLRPQAGDVLASARTARADVYTIAIVPAAARMRVARHSEAIEKVRELARGLRVDGWFTCNHTHYARVARFRGSRNDDTLAS
jgi:hypothetical protein